MSETLSQARAALAGRTAKALLQSLGASSVTLRFAVPSAGGDARQLGLATAQTEDAEIGPALLRTAEGEGPESELLLAGDTVRAEMERRNEMSVEALLKRVCGVVREDRLLRLVSYSAENFQGVDYLYRLRLAE
jgi:hypothetical protein